MFECTFFLPITETRFKKKKTDEDAPAQEKESGRGTSSPKIDSQKGETRVFGAPPPLTIRVRFPDLYRPNLRYTSLTLASVDSSAHV